jgi:hypothetical protein
MELTSEWTHGTDVRVGSLDCRQSGTMELTSEWTHGTDVRVGSLD